MKFTVAAARCGRARVALCASAVRPGTRSSSSSATWSPPDTPKGKGAQRFKELAEERTKGTREGRGLPEQPAVQGQGGDGGAAARLGADAGAVAGQVRPAGRQGIRGVRPAVHLRQLRTSCTRSPRARSASTCSDKLEPKGITGLAYWDNGFHDMSANKPLSCPADFKGLKMRIQSSKVLEAQMRALGAIPQVMAFTELYQAPAVRRGRRHRGRAVELLHAEDLRGAEAHDAVLPRPPGLCGDRQQEVLGRPAGRHPHDPRRRMKDATTYANAIAKKENDDALEAGEEVRQERRSSR